mmetsp:Transcript_142795/g.397774  ORF Transcript_142795/g.397774 Transcript_142795/m.397774 type:complete len:185 (-) Transcript_142795:268-822(-)
MRLPSLSAEGSYVDAGGPGISLAIFGVLGTAVALIYTLQSTCDGAHLPLHDETDMASLLQTAPTRQAYALPTWGARVAEANVSGAAAFWQERLQNRALLMWPRLASALLQLSSSASAHVPAAAGTQRLAFIIVPCGLIVCLVIWFLACQGRRRERLSLRRNMTQEPMQRPMRSPSQPRRSNTCC